MGICLLLCGPTPGARAEQPEVPGGTWIIAFAQETPPERMRQVALLNGLEVVRELSSIGALEVRSRDSGSKRPPIMSFGGGDIQSVIPGDPPLCAAREIEPEHSLAPAMLLEQAREGLGGAQIPGHAERAAGPWPARVPWGIARVKARLAWDRTTGEGVKVAVLDTGIDRTHPAVASNYKGGFNAFRPGREPFDDCGHGTHVAGTIAGSGGGLVGVAPGAELYAVKVLDSKGCGPLGVILYGLDWAVKNRVQVVNMSLNGDCVHSYEWAVRRAYEKGVTIVASMGNEPKAPAMCPAAYTETIAVAASTPDDTLWPHSTTGPETDFIAPGANVVSARVGGGFMAASGTSMAAPHVTGLAALAVSLGAGTPDQIRDALLKGAVPLASLDPSSQGAGMVEADRLVSAMTAQASLPGRP